MSLIEIKDIYKVYHPGEESEVRALDGVAVSIDHGEFVAVLGTSGSGKSTMMNILGCLDVPSHGSYLLGGNEVATLSDNALAKVRSQAIGFIFQGYNLITDLTAVENVELPLIYRNIGRSRRRELAIEAMKAVGLENRLHHRPSEMSGGQQQRVAIARAISTSPPIIMADEPTGNLDSRSSLDVMRQLVGLNDRGTTIILITHDINIASYAKRIIELRDGKIIRDHPVENRCAFEEVTA
ncbi:MAG TPA: ABC transporter ATP-binding protein [Terriglobales bacterium]|nr:ABC transporter ATP-binding protein [Terriglobales bacterium]